MTNSFWIAVLIVVIVVIYVIAKVFENIKKSEEQWKQVDKSKLKTWDDEDDRS